MASRKHKCTCTHNIHITTSVTQSTWCILFRTIKATNLCNCVSASSSSNTITAQSHSVLSLTAVKISTYLQFSSKLKGTYPSSETQRDCCRSEWCHIRISHWLYCSQRRGFHCRVQNQAVGHRPSSHLQNNEPPHNICLQLPLKACLRAKTCKDVKINTWYWHLNLWKAIWL